MANYRTSRILPTILTLVVIIIAIAGLVALARFLFFSGSTKSTTEVSQADVNRSALLTSTPGSSVTMSVRGPIVADENFNSYQISVSPASRQIKTFKGYLDTVVDQRDLANNVAAYEQFVHALDKANLPLGTQLPDEKNDVRGVCATGRVFEYTIYKENKPVQMLWTSTCGGSKGSLKASVEQVSQLFVNQIPDASKFISTVRL